MLTGLSASVAPLKAGNTEENKSPRMLSVAPSTEDLKYTAPQAGCFKASLLNLKTTIYSARILPGPEIPSKTSVQSCKTMSLSGIVYLYLLFLQSTEPCPARS